ncbi:hypothetical protein [Nocardia sp. alder85J]|uniref:hypothetical protein n=1 Tax=Nocardia sp. alder85J TaxID=2862949 RepID=UPI001CD47162|nr:hypothetical protein [Nocardia sp. alder85J]MCX4097212.1 hypothetical protein [Nocardia sp. alder85J]
MSGSCISGSCDAGAAIAAAAAAADVEAIRRFGGVARRAFREMDGAAEAAREVRALVADLVPHSPLAAAWCESAEAAADLVRRSAAWFARLADHTDVAVEGYAAADHRQATALFRLEVRI